MIRRAVTLAATLLTAACLKPNPAFDEGTDAGSDGLIAIAFRRTFVESGAARYRTDLPGFAETPVTGRWYTSPWAQIGPAMAYQLGLPVLTLREKGVVDDGILERGISGLYMPEFDLSQPIDDYLASIEWTEILGRWEGFVRAVVENKGTPPRLY